MSETRKRHEGPPSPPAVIPRSFCKGPSTDGISTGVGGGRTYWAAYGPLNHPVVAVLVPARWIRMEQVRTRSRDKPIFPGFSSAKSHGMLPEEAELLPPFLSASGNGCCVYGGRGGGALEPAGAVAAAASLPTPGDVGREGQGGITWEPSEDMARERSEGRLGSGSFWAMECCPSQTEERARQLAPRGSSARNPCWE